MARNIAEVMVVSLKLCESLLLLNFRFILILFEDNQNSKSGGVDIS